MPAATAVTVNGVAVDRTRAPIPGAQGRQLPAGASGRTDDGLLKRCSDSRSWRPGA